jgi:hypothetical protein
MARLLQISEPEEHENYSKMAYERYLEVKEKQQADLLGLINYIYGK